MSRNPAGTTWPRGLPTDIRWPLIAARDLFELRYGKALVEEQRRRGSIPVYGTNGRCGTHDTALFKGPGVVLGRKGQGPLGVEWCAGDYWVIDTAYSLRPLQPNVDLRYAYYLIKFVGLNHLKDGTSNPTLSRDSFGAQAFPLPPIEVQNAIAHVLAALDDKIELNRRLSETLEAIARALFKSWFVDFDPVRAKVAGDDPSLPTAVADLFPDSFQDSELGSIPQGWLASTIGSVADVIDCLHSKKPERRDTGRPLLQLWNIRDDGLIDMTDTYFITDEAYAVWTSRVEASAADCVITNVGRVGAVAQVPTGMRAALGRNMTAVRPNGSFPYPTVLIECLLSQAMRDEIARKMDTGTILDALNVRSIPRLRFVQAPASVLQAFESVVRPIRARMEQCLSESRILGAVRDALLPKLVSGELRVRDAERIVGRAV